MRWSDDSPGTASHFAIAYRVASPGALREPNESSWGHVLGFDTVPSANTLVRWVDENAFAPIVRARPGPTFGRPVRHGVAPIDYGPVLPLMPFGFPLAAETLPACERRCGFRSALAVSRFRLCAPRRLLHTFLSPASEELPPLSDTAPLIRVPEGLEPS